MTKKYGTNNQVMHAFAHGDDNHTQNGTGSVYRMGEVIYSYGNHFPMAKRIPNVCFLVTTDSYSVTTAKQMSYLWRAINGVLPLFYVPDVMAFSSDSHAANFRDYGERIEAALASAARARKYKAMHLENAQSLADNANRYADLFALDVARYDLGELDLENIRAEIAKLEAEKRERLAIENAEKIEQWRAGANVSLPMDISPMLRVSADGERVETSWHAEFPTSQAPLVWAVIKRCKRNGKRWVANGEQIKLGIYAVNWIDASGNVKAGCHNVAFAECERMALALGLVSAGEVA
jgi:hypothetical protein